jgi:hypothetical protein
MTFIIEETNESPASSDDRGSAPRIARRVAICSIAGSGARFAGIPAPAGRALFNAFSPDNALPEFS